MRESVSAQTACAVAALYPLPNFPSSNSAYKNSTPSLKKLILVGKSFLDLISSILRTMRERNFSSVRSDPGPCFSCRLSLLLIRAFSLSVFLQVLLVFILINIPNSNHYAENHTLGNVKFLFINFGLFSCFIYRLKKSISAAIATNQEDLSEEAEGNQKKLRNFRTSLTKLFFN